MEKRLKRIMYENFGKWEQGTVVCSHFNEFIVLARNPHGTHNFVMVTKEPKLFFWEGSPQAWCHGNHQSLTMSLITDRKLFKKTAKALYKRGRIDVLREFNYEGERMSAFRRV